MTFLLRFVAVQVFEGFEFLDEGFVLVLQHSHAVLQTLDVLLFLPATLARCFPVWHQEHTSVVKLWTFTTSASFLHAHLRRIPDRSDNTATLQLQQHKFTPLVPVFHKSDLPFACDFFSASASTQGW